MSTLYDALKKAEIKNAKEQQQRPAVVRSQSDDDVRKKKQVLLVLVLVFIFVSVVYFRVAQAKKEARSKKIALEKRKTALKPVVVPVTRIRQPGEYVLEGVIYSDDPAAVINGKLLRSEEKIDNLVVKSISPNSVELLKTEDNSIITLKM